MGNIDIFQPAWYKATTNLFGKPQNIISRPAGFCSRGGRGDARLFLKARLIKI
jgi:hypothetical protein